MFSGAASIHLAELKAIQSVDKYNEQINNLISRLDLLEKRVSELHDTLCDVQDQLDLILKHNKQRFTWVHAHWELVDDK